MSANKIILGTVQLGLDYGINNQKGKPSKNNAFKILSLAFQNNISTLDTAEAYGNSQELIGEYNLKNPKNKFKIISKLDANEVIILGHLENHINNNLKLLNIDKYEGYMFHNYESFKKREYLYKELIDIKEKGLTNTIGISLYSNSEIIDITKNYNKFDFIQIPFNLLDNHLKRFDAIELAKKNNIKIHTRSTFLQGLFFMDINQLPLKLKVLQPYLEKLNKIKNSHNLDMETFSLQYCLRKDYIDKVLIGVENTNQLIKNVKIINFKFDLDYDEIDHIDVIEDQLLNPSNWY